MKLVYDSSVVADIGIGGVNLSDARSTWTVFKERHDVCFAFEDWSVVIVRGDS